MSLSENISEEISDNKIDALINQSIKKIGEDIEAFKFNTAVSQMMILLNAIEEEKKISKKYFETFLKLLAPFAPHITEELWSGLDNKSPIHSEGWPKYDKMKLIAEEYTIVIQVNGKVRGSFVVPSSLNEEGVKNQAIGNEITQKWLDGKTPKKIVYVSGKLVSIVV